MLTARARPVGPGEGSRDDAVPPSRRLLAVRSLGVALFMAASLCLPTVLAAQATAYVALDDAAYRDLDALVAMGWVRGIMPDRRPYSRATFARAAAEAARRMGADSTSPTPRAAEALTRLRLRFAGHEGARLRGASLDAALADSPSRIIRSQYDRPERDSTLIDADVAPLLQRNGGRMLGDGATLAAEAWGDAPLGSHLVVAARPRVVLTSDPSLSDIDLSVVEAYARGLFGNLSVELGRNSVKLGRSATLGPVLSGNARGFDMVRLSMEEPRRLPWVFRHLGPVFAAGTLATLGNNRDNPGGVITLWEGSLKPHPNLTWGITLMSQQGGKGAPKATFLERLQESFLFYRVAGLSLPTDYEIGDKFLASNLSLTLPGVGADLYLEFATTDDHDWLYRRPRESFWNDAVWLAGVRWTGLDRQGRVDAWAEAAHNGVRPYTHHQFTSGLTLDRRVLGSPLGPLATAFQGGVELTGPRDRMALSGAWERYQGDQYHNNPVSTAPDYDRWKRTSDNPDEIRVRATVEWTRAAPATGLSLSARLGYEHVTRFDFTDEGRSNFLVQVGAEWTW